MAWQTRAQLYSQGKVSMINVISSTIKNEGFLKLYRGILPPILMEGIFIFQAIH